MAGVKWCHPQYGFIKLLKTYVCAFLFNSTFVQQRKLSICFEALLDALFTFALTQNED